MNRQTQNEPVGKRSSLRWWRVLSMVVVALALGVLMRSTLLLAAPAASPVAASSAQSAPDHGGDYDDHDGDIISRYGTVISRPVESAGTWTIGEKSYLVNESTVLEGALGVGQCVEVKALKSDPTTAIKIEAKDAFKCNGDDDDDDDDDDDHDDYLSVYGTVVTRPVESEGTWVISKSNATTVSFTVSTSTVLEGDLGIGQCVEVKALESDPTTATKIEAKDAFKCNGGDDDDDDDDDDRKIYDYGYLDSRPEGKVGTWVISGVAYSVTERTELDYDYGRLVVGACVKVETLASSPTVAREIESEKDYKCGDRDEENNAKAVIFGVIEELPADLQNGTWVVGGMSFVVSPTTTLVTNGGVFTTGVTVKVQFSTNMSDTNYAHRIEFKFGHNNPCRRFDSLSVSASNNGGGDHDHRDDDKGHKHRFYGYCPGREGRSVGLIDSRPTDGLLGEWMIGGVPYLANAYTKFQNGDDFLVGERVKVEYVVLSDTMRLATKIKESDDHGGVGNPNSSLIVGYVISKPVAFVGEWVINGASFEAISTTVFIERGSLFAVGAYVVVEYDIVDDRRLISRILTYVPPGAGDENKIGKLEAIGGVMIASADSVLQNDQVWTVAGVDYIVSEATQLVDTGGALAPGATVFVNSYTDNGQRYATTIRAQGGVTFIPHAAR